MKKLQQRIDRKIKHLFGSFFPFPGIVKYIPNGNLELSHVSAFSYGNAGDTILPVVLRDLFNQTIGVKKWKGIHVHKTVNDHVVSKINRTDAMIIGGGGLFLKDTNPNNLSGWQWSCSIEHLRKIKVPIVMFAVGYNRFRGQDDFAPVFKQHLNEFVHQASFIGIRNTGSISRLKEYLDTERLKNKLVFQPCMTTLMSKIYDNYLNYKLKDDFIAVNCAFDRENLRLNGNDVLHQISRVVKELSKKTKIRYYSHVESDNKILSLFEQYGIKYELVTFSTPSQMLKEYARPRLVIGMRGHAQMIPFGCLTPVLSIITHDKMQWFLNDISNPGWGVDVTDPGFEGKLLEKSLQFYDDYKTCMAEISCQQEKLWQITKSNVIRIDRILRRF
ncbi:MAG: polysaccharide pyruvyl transferase family protein [Mangrovibacterium sp.]